MLDSSEAVVLVGFFVTMVLFVAVGTIKGAGVGRGKSQGPAQCTPKLFTIRVQRYAENRNIEYGTTCYLQIVKE